MMLIVSGVVTRALSNPRFRSWPGCYGSLTVTWSLLHLSSLCCLWGEKKQNSPTPQLTFQHIFKDHIRKPDQNNLVIFTWIALILLVHSAPCWERQSTNVGCPDAGAVEMPITRWIATVSLIDNQTFTFHNSDNNRFSSVSFSILPPGSRTVTGRLEHSKYDTKMDEWFTDSRFSSHNKMCKLCSSSSSYISFWTSHFLGHVLLAELSQACGHCANHSHGSTLSWDIIDVIYIYSRD